MTLLDDPRRDSGTGMEPIGRRSVVGDALIVAGNAEPALATRTGERGVYAALGVTVIAVGVIAAATSISALGTATDLSWWILVPIGVFWGLTLCAFDRGVILGAPRRADTGGLASVIPYAGRVLVSLFIGFVVADFACMVLFAPDIEGRLAETNASRYTAVVETEQQAKDSKLLFEEEAVKYRTEALRALEAEHTAAQEAADLEMRGTGGTGLVGQGQVWQRKQAHADTVRANRDKAAADLATAQATLDTRRAEVTAEANETTASADTRAADVHRATGLLSRHEAMVDLVRGDTGALILLLMVTIVFLAIDLLPVLGKLMTGNTVYEQERRERARDVLHRLEIEREIHSAQHDERVTEDATLRADIERARSLAERRVAQQALEYETEFKLARLQRQHSDRMTALMR
jgi:hypothetical protein